MPESKPDREQEVREARKDAHDAIDLWLAVCNGADLASGGPPSHEEMAEEAHARIDRFESAVRASERAVVEKVAGELVKWWRFDVNQHPLSSWHECQDFFKLLRSAAESDS